MDINDLENYYNKRTISFPCIVLLALLMMLMAILPLLPSSLSQTFRPIFIFVCFLLPQKCRYRLAAEKWQLILIAYLGVILLVNPITTTAIIAYVSILLFGLFFVAASTRIWSKKEIKLILYAVIVAAAFSAIVILRSNPSFISTGTAKVKFFSETLNRNTLSFGIVPGVLCAEIVLLYSNGKKAKKLLAIVAMFVYLYTLVALGCRSGAVSAFLGTLLIYWQFTCDHYEGRNRYRKRFVFCVLLITAVLILYFTLQNTAGSRLFDLKNDSGRSELREVAMQLISQKPIFGGGFDYWTDSGQYMGTHNTFMTYMLASGYVGGLILAIFIISMLLECLKSRNLIPLAFLTELVCHTLTETGMDYYAYVPMVLAYIILRFVQNCSTNIEEIFNG